MESFDDHASFARFIPHQCSAQRFLFSRFLSFFFFLQKRKEEIKRKGVEKSRVPGVRFVEGKGRPNRVFGAFRPHSKVWYAKSRGCVESSGRR